MLFRYLQIRHAFRAQFPQLDNNPLMEVIRSSDPKKLISVFYSMLLLPPSSTSAYELKARWEVDVGATEDKEWNDAQDACKLVFPQTF